MSLLHYAAWNAVCFFKILPLGGTGYEFIKISLYYFLQLHGNLHTMCLFTQSYRTLCDPMDYSHQAPLSMGLSRQEY